MTTGLSSYTRSALLNALLRGGQGLSGSIFPAPVAMVYLALFLTDPELGTGELSSITSVGYARAPINTGSPTEGFTSPIAGSITNQAVVDFATATANWQTPIKFFGIFDAATGGNLLALGEFPSDVTVQQNDLLRFLVGSLVISLS